METEKAVLLIAEVLEVLVGNFTPDCGGDFIKVAACRGCPHLSQCLKFSKARKINSKLQSLLSVNDGDRSGAEYWGTWAIQEV